MCRRATVGLEPTPHAAASARHFVTSTFDSWGVDSVTDEASLAVSELVTNAVLHAQTGIEVSLCVAGGVAEISVRDHDARTPVLRPVRIDLLGDLDSIPALTTDQATDLDSDDRRHSPPVGRSGTVYGGRGLLIVDALADEWGVSERADGKEVWLSLPVQWPRHLVCPCDKATAMTASGRLYEHITGPWDDPR